MKIYTKTGDSGATGLFGGQRVTKDHARIEAYGTVDELNAALGVARAAQLPDEQDGLIAQIQNDLFALGAELSTPAAAAAKLDRRSDRIGPDDIARLEAAIDRFESLLPPLTQFILPGGAPSAAALHLARTVCRRAERLVVSLQRAEPDAASSDVLIYLNRLSDLLFVLARAANQAAAVPDVPWQKR